MKFINSILVYIFILLSKTCCLMALNLIETISTSHTHFPSLFCALHYNGDKQNILELIKQLKAWSPEM